MYGMNNETIEKAKYKIKANKAYMKSHGIVIDNKIVPFIDFVANSYINSDRYVAELQHRAWSIYEYARKKGLSNLFLTLTLPSNWHPEKTRKGKLVTNEKFGGRYYIGTDIVNPVTGEVFKLINSKENIEKYSPKGASKELSRLLKRFFDDRSYKNVDKEQRCYFRVTEPHKDGTPHLHVSFFFPEENIKSLVKALNRLFPAPQSKIELNVNSPVKYLLKYVLKTLDDLRGDENNITNLSLWYVYHGISRFYTSRTFVSLEVYRKLNGMYTLQQLTEAYDDERLKIQIDTQTNKIGLIENEHGTIYNPKPIMSTFQDPKWREFMEKEDETYYEYEFEPIKFIKEAPHYIDVDIDGEDFIVYEGSIKQKSKTILIKPKKQPHEMKDHELYEYYHSINIETVDINHYAYTRNMMINRNLLQEDIIPLNQYSDFIDDMCGYADIYEAKEVFK